MNAPVQTSLVSRMLMIARSPGAYRHFLTYSPISHPVTEEMSPLRWPP
jgi:hypothetical protein